MELNNENKKTDRRDYYQKYYQENKAYWYRKFKCDVCQGKYTFQNKCRHMATKKHIQHLEIENKINDLEIKQV
jgi:hypothetical protein